MKLSPKTIYALHALTRLAMYPEKGALERSRFLEGIETPLQDGDTVTIVPAVAGGR